MSPPVWALLVSVTHYFRDDMPPVEGANNDAMGVKDFLRRSKGVPEDHIKWLSNATATRKGIISAFKTHLIDNSQIKYGDAILFYFSGHGSYYRAPPGWIVNEEKAGDKDQDDTVEAILPWDEGISYDGDLYPTCAIPDRTLAVLINEVASSHGNNITIILDCCSSGHGTRAGMGDEPVSKVVLERKRVILDGEELFPRSVSPDTLTPLRTDIDSEILTGPHSPYSPAVPLPPDQVVDPTYDSTTDTDPVNEDRPHTPEQLPFDTFDKHVSTQVHARSQELAKAKRTGRFRALAANHVLIAACKPRERAFGGKFGGLLTTTWLSLMRNKSIRPQTYAEIVKQINLRFSALSIPEDGSPLGQHPQCEGVVRDRLIFEETMIKEDHFQATRVEGEKELFRVDAGMIHGVVEGSSFQIFALDTSLLGTELGTATVEKVGATTSVVHAPSSSEWNLPSDFATYTAAIVQKPRLCYTISGSLAAMDPETLEKFYKYLKDTPALEKAKDGDEDAVELHFYFRPDGKNIELRRLDPLLSVLPNPTPLITAEDIEETDLSKVLFGMARFNWLLSVTNATHPFAGQVTFEMFSLGGGSDSSLGFLERGEHPVEMVNGDIEVEEDRSYAIVLRNNSPMDLYAQVVYFDVDTYGIECLYELANDTAINFPAKGVLQLGGSRDLVWPLTYYVPEPESRSTLLVKVFLTQRPTKLSMLSQGALVGPITERERTNNTGGADTEGLWDTFIQRVTVH
ncbi:hypothetical protein BDY19DRAFT_906287 [Irpex rosettiformis]|uniref:Uncharacterized protein n=1 Tax=Irpex rosettiformis TaxID=378272 RepID=A0ACB8U3G9_9APHY|nr:hypothetical protein BDY19DRAFT_906287 [Irpex rosettiformis]